VDLIEAGVVHGRALKPRLSNVIYRHLVFGASHRH
jgi:hypothetical protein